MTDSSGDFDISSDDFLARGLVPFVELSSVVTFIDFGLE